MNAYHRAESRRPGQAGVNSSRRDFLKKAGTATAGSLAALLLPGAPRAGTLRPDASQTLPDSTPGDELFWLGIRSQFVLDQNSIYMNTGTEGSMPRTVLAGLYAYSHKFAQKPMDSVSYDEDLNMKQEKNCRCLAAFVGADPEEIVLTTNTTEGMHIAVNGLDLNEGDEILTTLHEHDAALSPLHVLQDRRGVTVTELALPSPAPGAGEIISAFSSAITRRTRALCFCHINYTTGLRMPVRELCALARTKGLITIVDGAHAMGMLNVDLHDLGCDFYACATHKWLNGPPGTGLLYIRSARENPCCLWPVLTEVYSAAYLLSITQMLQMRGQQNTPALCAMKDAMEFQNKIGKDRIEGRILALNRYLKEKIAEVWGPESLLTPLEDDALSSGLASFVPCPNFSDRYEREKVSSVYKALREQYGITIRYINFRDRQTDTADTYALRVSTHIFNSYGEIDELIAAVKAITG